MKRPKKSAVVDLADDLLVEILSRLPVKELHRSKCVSKGWRDLITDPLHFKKLPQTLHGFFLNYTEGLPSFINLLVGSPADPSIAFIKKLPGIDKIWLSGSCNGLLLFKHTTGAGSLDELGYVVLNPATEQWAAVPSEHEQHARPADMCARPIHTCLVYDPAVSSHFHLVIFYEETGSLATVHSYSSATGVWRHGRTDWSEEVTQLLGRRRRWGASGPQITGTALFSGMLYLILNDGHHVAEVDLEGKTRRIIAPPAWEDRPRSRQVRVHGCRLIFLGQSVGRLHCIIEERWAGDMYAPSVDGDDSKQSNLLSIWVLEDEDYSNAQKWALKHTVSCLHVFGSMYYRGGIDYTVVAIHPDSNLVFIFDYRKMELISYGFSSSELRVVKTLKYYPLLFPPYVPCFLDFLSVSANGGPERRPAGERYA